MFRASLCLSSGDRLYKTASRVSLDVLAADYVGPGHELSAAKLVAWLHAIAASTSRLTPDAVLYNLSPDDRHNDARNMLS